MLKRHRKPEYKLRGFVAILFLCIVFLVGFAHVYYNQQVLQVSCFALPPFESPRWSGGERTAPAACNLPQLACFPARYLTSYAGSVTNHDRASS